MVGPRVPQNEIVCKAMNPNSSLKITICKEIIMDVSDLVQNIANNCIKVQKKTFLPNSIITTYMEKRKQICILLDGKADLIRYDLKGNQDIIEKFNKNDIFGEVFHNVNTNNELFVMATKKCEVLLFLYDDIHIKCRQNCSFHTILISNLLELVLNKVISQNARIELLSKRGIREKLLTYFNILSIKSFSKNITIPFSLTELADYLSIDRSAMMRELKNLINEGFIIKNKNNIRLLY